METRLVRLTDDELLAFRDRITTPETKTVADEIARVRALQEGDSPADRFIASIVELAQREGRLGFSRAELNQCQVCLDKRTYALYRSTGRYHKKGEPNLDKPIRLRGVDLQHSFVRMMGYAKYGCCAGCWGELKPKLIERLNGIRAEIPKAVTGEESKLEYTHWVKCNGCRWEGWEAHLGVLHTIMSGGSYYGRCPQCKEKEVIFTKQFGHDRERWTLLDRETGEEVPA